MHFISVVTTIFVVLQAGVTNVFTPSSRCRSRVSSIFFVQNCRYKLSPYGYDNSNSQQPEDAAKSAPDSFDFFMSK